MGCGASSQPDPVILEPVRQKEAQGSELSSHNFKEQPSATATGTTPKLEQSLTLTSLPPVPSDKPLKDPLSAEQASRGVQRDSSRTVSSSGDIGSTKLSPEEFKEFGVTLEVAVVPSNSKDDLGSKKKRKQNSLSGSRALRSEDGGASKSSFDLTAWKTFYKDNKDTSKLTEYFWSSFDASQFSIYCLVYNRDDIDAVYQGSNVIHGLYSRNEDLQECSFGIMYVYLATLQLCHKVGGFMIFPGQSLPDEIRHGGDYENYKIMKADLHEDGFKSLFNALLTGKAPAPGLEPVQARVFM